MSVPGNMCKAPGEFPERLAEKWRMQLFVLQRENKMNTSDTFTKPTTFLTGSGLIQMVHKVHKCTSNISLYC